jgi:hypothetical protein
MSDLDLNTMLDDGDTGTNDDKAIFRGQNNKSEETGGSCYGWIHDQFRVVGKNFDCVQIWTSVFQNNGLFAIVLCFLALTLFIIIMISHAAYASSCYQNIVDDMKPEIDPERIYAQEISKKTSKIMTSSISSEFYFTFFFVFVFQTIVSYGFGLYIFEKNAIHSRQHTG